MIYYAYIGIAVIVIAGGLSFVTFRRKRASPPTTAPIIEEVSEEISEEPAQPPPETAPIATESVEAHAESGQTVPPVVPELSRLPEEAKNALLNAVWYRCENPNCNYTQFLDVHHIVPEVEGGTNRLDNLIVLCPACHAAADTHEIIPEQLVAWIRQREERFRFALDWPYK